MGLFSRSAEAVATSPAEAVHAGWPLNSPFSSTSIGNTLAGWPGGRSGQASLAVPTIYRCVNTIATKVGKFELLGEAKRSGTQRKIDLLEKPDPKVSRYRFLTDTTMAMLFRGNAYWRVHRAGTRIIGVENLNPDTVGPYWADDRHTVRRFKVANLGDFSSGEVVQVPMLLLPGALAGVGPIEASRIVWEGQAAADKMAASNFKEGVLPSGVLKSPTALSDTNAAKLLNKFVARHAGSREPILLSGGLEYDQLAVTARDAQWVEHRMWTAGDCAGLFGVPAALLSIPMAGGVNLTYTNLRDARTELLHMALDPVMCEIGSAFETLLPGVSVGWDTTSYLPPLEATNPEAAALTNQELPT